MPVVRIYYEWHWLLRYVCVCVCFFFRQAHNKFSLWWCMCEFFCFSGAYALRPVRNGAEWFFSFRSSGSEFRLSFSRWWVNEWIWNIQMIFHKYRIKKKIICKFSSKKWKILQQFLKLAIGHHLKKNQKKMSSDALKLSWTYLF